MDKEQNLFFERLLSAYAERKREQEQKKMDEVGKDADKSKNQNEAKNEKS